MFFSSYDEHKKYFLPKPSEFIRYAKLSAKSRIEHRIVTPSKFFYLSLLLKGNIVV